MACSQTNERESASNKMTPYLINTNYQFNVLRELKLWWEGEGMMCKGWKCNLRWTTTMNYSALLLPSLFLSVTLIYLSGIFSPAGKTLRKGCQINSQPTPAFFVIYGSWPQKYLIRCLIACFCCIVCSLCSPYVLHMWFKEMICNVCIYREDVWIQINVCEGGREDIFKHERARSD